jgi:origin recognition complex subunit 6
MNRTIELNLESIIPRHSGALPRELKELTASLLAQSRTKCNLGAEEEAARTYLCANLACERYAFGPIQEFCIDN